MPERNCQRKKLDDEAVRVIRAEYKVERVDEFGVKKAVNIIELAQRFKVSQQVIRKVAKGIIYQNVR